jgi:hypothetical protein
MPDICVYCVDEVGCVPHQCRQLISCVTEGAPYVCHVWLQVHMPPGALAAAEAAGKKPDVFYCLRWVWAVPVGVWVLEGYNETAKSSNVRC